MKKLGSGQLQVENDTVSRSIVIRFVSSTIANLISPPPPLQQVVAPGESKDWAEEFAKQREDESSEGFWERLEKEWEEMAR